jgi:hypothetical protein
LLKITTMKIFTTVLIILAVALIIFNVTLLDYNNPFEGNSMIALIGIVASFCAIFILLIFRMSKKIVEKLKH